MKILGLLAVIITGALLLYAVGDFPDWGDPHSPANSYLSTYYIEKTVEETSVPNFVTALLADYRGYDTMYETSVILTAGIAVFAILRHNRRRKPNEETIREEASLIVQISCRLLIPVIQLFAFYVVAHGHHSPGGGFQGGVILAASLILLSLAYDLKTALARFSEKLILLFSNIGVLIYAGTGFLCLLLGRHFLNYAALHRILATDEIYSRSLGIFFVEIGVAFTVTSIMFGIYAILSSHGDLEEGL